MNRFEERMLDLALAEVLGGRAPPDLAPRILAASRRPAWLRAPRRAVALAAVAAAAVLLAGGAVLWLASRPAPPPPPVLSPAEEARVLALIARARTPLATIDPSTPQGGMAQLDVFESTRALCRLVAERPDVFPFVRERLFPIEVAGRNRDVTERTLEILAHGPDPGEDSVIATFLEAYPETFPPDLVLLLAERGVASAEARLGAPFAGGALDPDLVMPAVFFALRGDRRGEAVLREFLARVNPRAAARPEHLAVAAGLYRLGDRQAWRDLAAVARTRVEAGEANAARPLVVGLLYFQPAVAEGRPVPVSDLWTRLKDLEMPRLAELRDPTRLRALLDSLID